MSDEETPAGEGGLTTTEEVSEPLQTVEEDEGFLGTPWNRRTFLKAAALGTAAAAVFQKGPGWKSWGPAAAYADDLSGLNCTANDVRIVGPGIILNEPCTCTGGFFDAQVQFHIINNTGTDRYCVTAHLCPGLDANGNPVSGFPQRDVVIGDIPANFDGNKTVTIPNYPCGSGLVCFGVAGSQPDGSFLKGENCPAGKCCTTITWNVKASDPCPDTTRQISSKCRHQQVCIQGFGITAACADGACATRSLTNGCCSVACGASLNVKIVASGQSGATCANPPAISVKRPGSSTYTAVTLNAAGCYVDSSPATGTYTFRATDCHNCFRETTLEVCVASIAAPTATSSAPACAGGNATVTVTNPDANLSYTFKEGSTVLQGPGSSSSYTGVFSAGSHTVTVIASNGSVACDQSTTTSFTVPAALSIGAPTRVDNPCSGKVTFQAGAVSGGTGPYTIQLKLDNGSFVNGTGANGNQFVYSPSLVTGGGIDTSCHSLVAKVTDANGCTATSTATTFSQCISTTTGCT